MLLLVEGESDREFCDTLFSRSEFLGRNIRIETFKTPTTRDVRELTANSGEQDVAMLVDADGATVHEARLCAMKEHGDHGWPIYVAVPTIEAWLFADHSLATDLVHTPNGRALLRRTPPPERIPHPKAHARWVFGSRIPYREVAAAMDIGAAAMHSVSFGQFVSGMAERLGLPPILAMEETRASSLRNAIAAVLSEELATDDVVVSTLDGEPITAERMLREVEAGTDFGRRYAVSVLRVARDVVAARAGTARA